MNARFSSYAALFLCLSACSEDAAAPAVSDAGNGTGGNPGSTVPPATGGQTTGSGGAASASGGAAEIASGGASGTVADAGRDASPGPRVPPKGRSAGCGKTAPGGVSSNAFTLRNVTVTGVDPAFISAHPPNGGSWTERTYFVRLPSGYEPSKAYALSIGGGGCGASDGKSGNSGGLAALPKGETVAIQVGLNYVYPKNAGACFADGYVNTPDLPYFDAVLAELEASYCIDRDRVFMSGFSSGAWETYLLGCARAGVVRGIGTAAGGLRRTRPPCTEYPVAAILVAGLSDTENPIGPLAPPGKNDSLGSAPARDDLLARNGCVGTATKPWDPTYPACVQYTGCPAAYPVVWCAIDAGHTEGGDLSANGFWKFWSSLPPP